MRADPTELLLRVRDQVVHTLGRIPGYMCTQTIDRCVYETEYDFIEVKEFDDPQRSHGRLPADINVIMATFQAMKGYCWSTPRRQSWFASRYEPAASHRRPGRVK